VFVAFDIDDGGTIDRKELSKFLFSSIVGLCKLLGLPNPSFTGIQTYTYAVFAEVDGDNSGTVDFEEFSNWIKQSEILQEFLLTFTGQQTLERA
jgi:Ca2+-binding EF-hand superfamily protein